jgi:hypothetical protein
MRTFNYGSFLIIVVGMLGGCGSMGTKPAASADSAAGTKAFVMQSGGANVLSLTTSADTKCVAGDGSLHFTTQKYEVEVWLVSGAKTVDEAMGRVSSQIVSEFKNFKPNQTTDLTFAGSPAKRSVGIGDEADDGDPGNADVIVFKVGDHVFVSCTHGENLTSAAQQGMLALVQTAQMP